MNRKLLVALIALLITSKAFCGDELALETSAPSSSQSLIVPSGNFFDPFRYSDVEGKAISWSDLLGKLDTVPGNHALVVKGRNAQIITTVAGVVGLAALSGFAMAVNTDNDDNTALVYGGLPAAWVGSLLVTSVSHEVCNRAIGRAVYNYNLTIK